MYEQSNEQHLPEYIKLAYRCYLKSSLTTISYIYDIGQAHTNALMDGLTALACSLRVFATTPLFFQGRAINPRMIVGQHLVAFVRGSCM